MKHRGDNVLFHFYFLSFLISHKQYGGKTYPFRVGFIFLYFFEKMLTFSEICYILYIENSEREVKKVEEREQKNSKMFFNDKRRGYDATKRRLCARNEYKRILALANQTRTQKERKRVIICQKLEP